LTVAAAFLSQIAKFLYHAIITRFLIICLRSGA
jgi:hypothetical protein